MGSRAPPTELAPARAGATSRCRASALGWQAVEESNLRPLIWRQRCFHYTNGLRIGTGRGRASNPLLLFGRQACGQYTAPARADSSRPGSGPPPRAPFASSPSVKGTSGRGIPAPRPSSLRRRPRQTKNPAFFRARGFQASLLLTSWSRPALDGRPFGPLSVEAISASLGGRRQTRHGQPGVPLRSPAKVRPPSWLARGEDLVHGNDSPDSLSQTRSSRKGSGVSAPAVGIRRSLALRRISPIAGPGLPGTMGSEGR